SSGAERLETEEPRTRPRHRCDSRKTGPRHRPGNPLLVISEFPRRFTQAKRLYGLLSSRRDSAHELLIHVGIPSFGNTQRIKTTYAPIIPKVQSQSGIFPLRRF